MKRTLFVTVTLAGILVLGTTQTIPATSSTVSVTSPAKSSKLTASQYSASTSQYSASFHIAEERNIVPGGTACAGFPITNTWGFDSWLFMEVSIPTFNASEIVLEPGEEYGPHVPVLTFTPNPGWTRIEDIKGNGVWTSVWLYSEPVDANQPFTPLFDDWTMTNFRVRNGQCGVHTYTEIIASANRATVKRYSLQADGISGNPETLWSMVK